MSRVVSHISLAISEKVRDRRWFFRPRQYDAVICSDPLLSVQAADIHRSSMLCAYATWMQEFSSRRETEGDIVTLNSMLFGSGCSRSIEGEHDGD